jgi:hypothetical protein
MNAIEMVNAITEIAPKFAELYNDFDCDIQLINIHMSYGVKNPYPCAHIKGIYTLAELLGKTPYWVDDNKVCIDYKGVRFVEYTSTVHPDD